MKKYVAVFAALVCILMVITSCNVKTCEHEWGEWITTKEATCTEAGTQERSCEKCGESETSKISALDHDWDEATCSNPKTCKSCAATEGTAAAHTPNADDGDCTTAITCSVCGTVTTEANAAHTGGEATCENKAECEVCGKRYGELAGHTPNADDGDCTTAITCSVCETVIIEANATHTGGEATCNQKAICADCGMEYGELVPHTPNADDGDCTTAITCSVCGTVTTEANATHTGGEATCENEAECEVCGKRYGELADHTPIADDGDCTTAVTCSVCGKVIIEANATHTPNADDGDCTTEITCSICETVTTEANATHTGGEATCDQKAICESCGMEYGELAPHTPNADDGDCTTAVTCSVCETVTTEANATHTPNADDGDCTTAITCSVCGTVTTEANASHTPNADDGDCTTEISCSVCGSVTTEANATHTGGEATCNQKAICEVCGMEYGEVAEHSEQIWIKHLDKHYLVYSCCYVQISDAEGHTMVDGICTSCGFKPSITITSPEVTTEDTRVTVEISVEDNPGILGLYLTLQYNEDVFDLVSVANGEALSTLAFTQSETLDSGCKFMWDGVEIRDEDVKDGVVLSLTFDILSEAPEGEYSILLKADALDNDVTRLNLFIQGGNITVRNI